MIENILINKLRKNAIQEIYLKTNDEDLNYNSLTYLGNSTERLASRLN